MQNFNKFSKIDKNLIYFGLTSWDFFGVIPALILGEMFTVVMETLGGTERERDNC